MLKTTTETIEIAGQSVPRNFGDSAGEYAAARSGAVVIPRSHEGRVRAVGRDRLDLLDRMSTNDLTGMAVGEARPTVLTTPIGRMVDVLWVLNRGDTALYLTSPGRATAVRKWLAGHIFFRDEVKFEDAWSALGQLGIYGPRAGAVAEALAGGAESLDENRFVEREGLIVLRRDGEGYTVIAPSVGLGAAWDQAAAAGAVPAGEDTYQTLRLAAGRPYGGHEITEDYIPLEANLWQAVSFTKGCYIGQEIIARMESRGKLARRLSGIKLDAPIVEGSQVLVGDMVAGKVTSAGVIPGLGPAALAYLKSAAAEPGTRVTVSGVSGTVVTLPFE